jgi:adenosylcobyric acid synthase
VVEGAGSPAETNLRAGDIANMGFATAANVPVVLVGDIDRGHVIASLVGAWHVLDEADRGQIAGFIINKFRGDPALFDAGRRTIVARTGWQDLGLVPWLAPAAKLPPEDAVMLQMASATSRHGRVRVAVPMLSRIANFDDFDPLRLEPHVDFVFVPPGAAIPGNIDLVIIPGSKATIADLAFLRAQGWDIDIQAHLRRGGRVLGICGGYQMLGRRIADPDGVEGPPNDVAGLGLLDVETILTGDKVLRSRTGRLAASGARAEGYEIHVGRTTGDATGRPFLILDETGPDGAISLDGRVAGAYLHGLFNAGTARAALLDWLGAASTGIDQSSVVDGALDDIAAILEGCLDVEQLEAIARQGQV